MALKLVLASSADPACTRPKVQYTAIDRTINECMYIMEKLAANTVALRRLNADRPTCIRLRDYELDLF